MQLQGPNAIAKAGLSFLLTAGLSSASEQAQRKPVNLAVVENYLQNAMHGARLRFHDPEATIERMGLHDGQMIAGVGSAAGFYTLRLARRVEPHGVVFAVDVQERMLDHLRRELDAETIGGTRAHVYADALYLAGKPASADLVDFAALGVYKVVNVGHVDEAEAVEAAGMLYLHVPLDGRLPSSLEALDPVMEEILNAGRDRRVLVHDDGGSETGAIWALFRAIGEGVALDKALEEGRALGLEDAKARAADRRLRFRMAASTMNVARRLYGLNIGTGTC